MNDVTKSRIDGVERVLLQGNLAALSQHEKLKYYAAVCESLGLNPLTKPFEYLKFQGKEILYPAKNCAEQLRKIHGISIAIAAHRKEGDLLLITARATTGDGRSDESIAALDCGGMAGERLANAIMIAETKAKRRVTLSICGLGMLAEEEIESVNAETFTAQQRLAATIKDAAALPAAPSQDVWRYRIPNLSDDQARWLEKQGAEFCEADQWWESKRRLPPLDKHEVRA